MDRPPTAENSYTLLAPGPTTTSNTVRTTIFRDLSPWDDDFLSLVQDIREKLTALAAGAEGYTSVLFQGSGTAILEAVIGSVIPEDGRLLVLANGAYGQRLAQIAGRLKIPCVVAYSGETNTLDMVRLERTLAHDPTISHVAMVHLETATGMLNPVADVGRVVKRHQKTFIVDGVSSLGCVPLDAAQAGVDFLAGVSETGLGGLPGLGFVVARRQALLVTEGRARSLTLDLFDQWQTMEKQWGRWRFTPPTQLVRAFQQAFRELDEETLTARFDRFRRNHNILVGGMTSLSFRPLLPEPLRSPVVTAFHYPEHSAFQFDRFRRELIGRGFVLYPGKVTSAPTFRVGTIGQVDHRVVGHFLGAVEQSMYWMKG